MEDVNEIREQTKVVVELDPSLMRFFVPEETEGQAFQSYLLRYLNDLVADLAMPTEISLVVSSDDENKRFAVNSYQVIINDRKCRLPFPTIIPRDITVVELARSVAQVIYQNRELFVTPSLAEKVLQKLLAENSKALAADLPLEEFYKLLSELVRRGFKIDRAKGSIQLVKEKEQSVWNSERIFEETISSWDTIGIRIIHSNAYYNRMLDAGEKINTQSADDDKQIEKKLDTIQDAYFQELGVILPKVNIDTEESLEEYDFRVQLNDLRFPPILGLPYDKILVNDTIDGLALIGVIGERANNPFTNSEGAIMWDEEGARKICYHNNLTTWTSADFVYFIVSSEVRRNVGSFLTADAVKFNMNLLRETFPAIVDKVLARFDLVKLTRILRTFLDEELSIRNLLGLLEALVAINGVIHVDQSKYNVFFPNTVNLCPITEEKKIEDLEVGDYENYLRMAFKRYISFKYSRGSNILFAYLMAPEIETRLKSVDKQPLKDAEYDQLMKAILNELEKLPTTSTISPVILMNLDTRKGLRNLIEKEFPGLAVLSYQELSPDINIQPIAQIAWN